MSWRHPATISSAMAMTANAREARQKTPPTDPGRSASGTSGSALGRLRGNVGYSYRLQSLEKGAGRGRVEAGIGGLDAEKEPVGRSAVERRHVEHRVIRLRQLVERPHPHEAG